MDLAAPGSEIYSTAFNADNFYLGGYYLEGSSFAAAYVSGAFALVLAQYPGEPHQQTISRVLSATDPLPALAGKGATGGRLNVRKALSPPIRLTVLPGAGSGPVSLRLSGGPNRTCVIEASTNLVTWGPVFTNTTSAGGTFDFTDEQSADAAQRFYRAVSAP